MASKRELTKYYNNTEYLTFVGDKAIVLRIGKASRELDKLLKELGSKQAIFITAWNPRSHVSSPTKNKKWNAALRKDLKRMTKNVIIGQGRSLDHQFFEDSFLAIGISKAKGAELSRKYVQNAFVAYREKEKAELVWTLEP